MEGHRTDRSRSWQGQAGGQKDFVYTRGRRGGWRPSKHESQHASMALAIDGGLGVSSRLHRSGQCLYRWVSWHGPQRPVCVCVPHPALTFEHGADPPDPQAALTCKLAEGELHEEERDPAEDQHDEVGEHEGAWQAGRGLAQGGLGRPHPLPAQNPTAKCLCLARTRGGCGTH